MELTKEQSLANLYTLRAGLSLMSESHDRTLATQGQIRAINKNISIIQEQNAHSINNLDKSIDELEDRISYRKKFITETEYECETVKKTYEKYHKSARILNMLGCIFTFIFLGFLLLYILDRDLLAYVIGMFVSLVLFAPLCAVSESLSQKADIPFKRLERLEKNLEEANTELTTFTSEKNALLINKKEMLTRIDIETNQQFEDYEKQIALLEKDIDKELIVFDVSHKAMVAQFSTFLDERDWSNVDLIIYLYETGRVTDLRDALLQVDMERRNEKLVNAIAYATREISSTIERGFGELQSVVEIKMNALNSSINSLSASIDQQNDILNEKLDSLSQIANAQEALQRKIECSSSKMANDVKYMKDLAYRTYHNM